MLIVRPDGEPVSRKIRGVLDLRHSCGGRCAGFQRHQGHTGAARRRPLRGEDISTPRVADVHMRVAPSPLKAFARRPAD
ncbi:hypothetical protein F2981_14120 [Sinorhizobium meliloti]|nr:hypothetical protein [Sinorhizobium meliloti]